MRLWITGREGLLGSCLTSLCQLLGIEHLATNKVEADLRNETTLKQCIDDFKPSHLINCAAYTKVDLAEKEPEIAFAINRDGAASLASLCFAQGIRFVHVSTNYVFEGTGEYTENSPCEPRGVYGISKWEGEKKVLKTHPRACIVRTSWVFGKGGNNLISSLWGWLQKNESVKVASDQVACLTYVKDLAESLLLLRDKEGIFHFSNQGAVSRYQVALELLEHARQLALPLSCKKVEPVLSASFGPMAPRPLISPLSTDKYTALFGPPRSWKEILKEYILHDA